MTELHKLDVNINQWLTEKPLKTNSNPLPADKSNMIFKSTLPVK